MDQILLKKEKRRVWCKRDIVVYMTHSSGLNCLVRSAFEKVFLDFVLARKFIDYDVYGVKKTILQSLRGGPPQYLIPSYRWNKARLKL